MTVCRIQKTMIYPWILDPEIFKKKNYSTKWFRLNEHIKYAIETLVLSL